ncbi:MAG: hypothetical protein WCP85_22980, partial [Mariniphaga sp.]
MENSDLNEYEVERFSAKMYLDTFTFDLYNSFESSADTEIARLIDKFDMNKKNYIDLDRKLTKESDEQVILDIESEKCNCIIDIEYIREEIWALIEMKIIYSFKSLEINTKKLIRTTFSGTKTK